MAITPDDLETILRRLQPTANVKHFTQCPARFAGTRTPEAVDDFVTSADFYKQSEGITDLNALAGLSLLLEGPAHTWWTGVRSAARTWKEAIQMIREEFAPTPPAYQIYQALFRTTQDKHVPTGAFVAEKRAWLAQLQPPPPEETQIDMVYGLLHPDIRRQMPREAIDKFTLLLLKARTIETNWREDKENEPEQANPKHSKPKPNRPRCTYCRAPGHDVAVCRKRAAQAARPITEAPPNQPRSRENTVVKCYGCQKPGVIRRNCPSCNPPGEARNTNIATDFCALQMQDRTRPALRITVHGTPGTALLDTGARSSIASPELLAVIARHGYPIVRKSTFITLADGRTQQKQVQIATIPVVLNDRTIPTTFVNLAESPNAKTLLGIDFIEDAGLLLDFGTMEWCFSNAPRRRHNFVNKERPIDDNQIDAIRAVVHTVPRLLSPIPDTPTSHNSRSMECDHESGLVDGYGPDFTPNRVSQETTSETPLPGPSPWLLSASETQHFEELWQEYSYPVMELAAIELRVQDEGLTLQPEERSALNQVLSEHSEVFNASGPPTPYAEHRINTGSHAPISQPPYRMTPSRAKTLGNEIQALLNQGIIEECESAWSAPVVMVPKKDGGVRLCIDYRRLNEVTIPDSYPMPRIDDLLQATGGTAYMSTMDLRAGYHQIQVHPDDRDKTCFVTPQGAYRFNRLPFGLRNAPATFQRLIDQVRRGLGQVELLAYLDDLILLSKDFQSHIEHLRLVFQRLREFQLRINREKCHFGCTQVRYLGHLITPQGIEADPGKIQAILDIPSPRNVKHLISFLQTCSWYRKFIPNFARTSQPLTNLTRKNTAWKWGPPQQDAFQRLRQALTATPVLRQADHSQPFTLRTDASAYALGAALLQGEGTDERPIEYASRLLSPAEQNYSTTEREALAVVWAVRKFQGYIEETSVVVLTDHQPLKWLMSLKTPSGRLARWALQLQPFNLSIGYVPGKANVVADMLSRATCRESPAQECAICAIFTDIPQRGPKATREAQLEDAELRKIILAFEQDLPEETHRWAQRGYLVSQGVLYRYSPHDDQDDAQLVIPCNERQALIRELHDAPTSGHPGRERTIQKISKNFFWPGMRRQITQYVANCPDCQRYKPSNVRPPGLLQTPIMRQRFETVAMDLFGPLPESQDGKRWILIIEDTATRWTELFALSRATADLCAWTFVQEICLRYGTPRRLISDNGTQFISAVMQKVTYCLGIEQQFTPVYHPAANPVERRNRELKTQLAIQVGEQHSEWPDKLHSIRFALNSATCQSTGYTPAFLTFGRELRTPSEVHRDLRHIVQSENFIPEITPRLLRMAETLHDAQETHELEQDRRKQYADKRSNPSPRYQPGDLVWVETHLLSSTAQGRSSKLNPRRDGPYRIVTRKGATSYEVAPCEHPTDAIATYHVSALRPCHLEGGAMNHPPKQPLRRRGRPRKTPDLVGGTATGPTGRQRRGVVKQRRYRTPGRDVSRVLRGRL